MFILLLTTIEKIILAFFVLYSVFWIMASIYIILIIVFFWYLQLTHRFRFIGKRIKIYYIYGGDSEVREVLKGNKEGTHYLVYAGIRKKIETLKAKGQLIIAPQKSEFELRLIDENGRVISSTLIDPTEQKEAYLLLENKDNMYCPLCFSEMEQTKFESSIVFNCKEKCGYFLKKPDRSATTLDNVVADFEMQFDKFIKERYVKEWHKKIENIFNTRL